ncbi:hypothetical protein I4U23_022525 [Adineta vaga]|nr:hypothetical protein I4U23_022525 [Adineta vaga]
MAKQCWIQSCKNRAEGFCAHCSEELCHHHFMEHKEWLQEQLLPMIKHVNITCSRLQRCDMDQAIFTLNCLSDARHELNQWRSDCVRHIDDVYDRALQQITVSLEKHKKDAIEQNRQNLDSLSRIRRKLEKLLSSGNIAHRQLQSMKQQLHEIKRKEQEQNNHPDIRISTEKIDVDKFVTVVSNYKGQVSAISTFNDLLFDDEHYVHHMQSDQDLYREKTTRVELSKKNALHIAPSDDSDEEQRQKRQITRTFTFKSSLYPSKVHNTRVTRTMTQVKRHGYQERVAYANEHTRKKIPA